MEHPLWEAVLENSEAKISHGYWNSLYRKPRRNEAVLFTSRMLTGKMREYIIKKVKAPLRKAIILIGKRLPEPTRDNTLYRNTHILMDIRDKFFKYERNSDREELFRFAWKILIAEYEHDRYYRYRLDWIIEEINKRGWEPRLEGWPEEHWWKEPPPYGGKYVENNSQPMDTVSQQ